MPEPERDHEAWGEGGVPVHVLLSDARVLLLGVLTNMPAPIGEPHSECEVGWVRPPN